MRRTGVPSIFSEYWSDHMGLKQLHHPWSDKVKHLIQAGCSISEYYHNCNLYVGLHVNDLNYCRNDKTRLFVSLRKFFNAGGFGVFW